MSELAILEQKRQAYLKAKQEYEQAWLQAREEYWKKRAELDRQYGITPLESFFRDFDLAFEQIWRSALEPFKAVRSVFEEFSKAMQLASKKDWEGLHKHLTQLGFQKPKVEYGEGEFPKKSGYWQMIRITEE